MRNTSSCCSSRDHSPAHLSESERHKHKKTVSVARPAASLSRRRCRRRRPPPIEAEDGRCSLLRRRSLGRRAREEHQKVRRERCCCWSDCHHRASPPSREYPRGSLLRRQGSARRQGRRRSGKHTHTHTQPANSERGEWSFFFPISPTGFRVGHSPTRWLEMCG